MFVIIISLIFKHPWGDIVIENFGEKITFLPDATRGAVKGLTNEQLTSVGTDSIVVNTLHLLIHPGIEQLERLGGVKKFMNWNGIALSDSGGFQIFSLLHNGKWKGKITEEGALFKSPRDGTEYELTPERSIDIQIALNTDILVVLDDCRKATTTREEAEVSVRRTLKWARRCKDHFMSLPSEQREGKLLTAVVQGANFLDLRELCAKELVKIGFDGYNFGGYVLDDEGDLVVEELRCVYENTPMDKFNYAMGLGRPEDILEAAKIGYTVFDTVIPTRNARHGSIFTSDAEDGTIRIRNSSFCDDMSPLEKSCNCTTCQNYSRSYIHHMLKGKEMTGMTLATIHNLRFYNRLTELLNRKKEELENIQYKEVLAILRKSES